MVQRSSHERPPNIPLFTGECVRTVSRKDKGNTAEVLASAAIHLIDHFHKSESSSSSQPHSAPQNLTSQDQLATLSPGKKVNIRSQSAQTKDEIYSHIFGKKLSNSIIPCV